MSDQNGTSAHALIDTQEVYRALSLLVEPGQVVEVRALEASLQRESRYTETLAGYFDNAPDLIAAIATIRKAMGIYITLQPMNPDILHRAKNKLVRQKKDFSTPDKYITGYRWLLIDSDPERVSGISSTDEEHEQALAHSRTVRDALTNMGWPSPILADSGNGAHLLYRIDLEATASDLVRRVLEGLAERFDGASIHIDRTVYNPSRICKLYGTLACKGDNTAERPHRLSRLLVVPESLTPVSRALLETVAVPTPPAQPTPTRGASSTSKKKGFDLDAWILQHGIETLGPEPYQNGTRWVLKTCPWDATHTDRSAVITLRADGTIGAMCHHNGCHGKGWKDLRVLYEPDAYRLQGKRESKPPIPYEEGHEGSTKHRYAQLLHMPDVELPDVLRCLRDTEWGDSNLFAHLFARRVVYDHLEKKWYFYLVHAWQSDQTEFVKQLVSGVLASVYLRASADLNVKIVASPEGEVDLTPSSEEAVTQKTNDRLKQQVKALYTRAVDLRTSARNSSVLSLARTHLDLAVGSPIWDSDPWLLGTPCGVLDLRTGLLHPGHPEQYIRTSIPTTWQGLDTPAPRFEQFLQEIFADREEKERSTLLAFLQRVLGYGITGHVNEHLFLMLYGEEGRNGKDTLMSLLFFVLGELVGAVSNDVIIASGKNATPGSAKPHLCSLQGKRMAWASETDKGARFDVAQVKFLTGGGAIPARHLYGEDFTFAPSHLLILLTNNKPHADAKDKAFWDRICPITFNLRFVDQPIAPNERKKDTTLGKTLQAEASGILAWLVRGCINWQREGLQIPECVLRDCKIYRGQEDTLGQFLDECCVRAETAQVLADQLFERYKTWAKEGILKPMTRTTFGLEISKMFPKKRSNQGYCYIGIGLLDEDGPLDDGSVPLCRVDQELSTDGEQVGGGVPRNGLSVGCVPFSKKSPLVTRVGDTFARNHTHPTLDPNDESVPLCIVDEKLYTGNETAPQAGGDGTSSREECIPPEVLCTPGEPALQEAGEGHPKVLSVGCVPFSKKSPSYARSGEKFYEEPYTPYTRPKKQSSEPALQEGSESVHSTSGGIHFPPGEKQGITPPVEPSEQGLNQQCIAQSNYTLSTNGLCSTRFEKADKKVVHEANATQMVAGYGWCDRCTAQQQWVAYGESHHYPRFIVSGKRGFVVKAGLAEWLRFAQEAGYTRVAQAVATTTKQPEDTFDPVLQQLRDLLQPWREKTGAIALDLETTGLDCQFDRVISIALGMPGSVTILDMRPYYGLSQETRAHWKQTLATLFQKAGITWVGHNLKFDWAFLRVHFDLKLRHVYDTMLAEQVRLAGSLGPFTLLETAKRYDLAVSKEQRAWFEGLDKRSAEWAAPFPEDQRRYMIQDVEVAYQVYERQHAHLEQHGLLAVVSLENEALPALAAMEVHGVLIDQTGWRAVLQAKHERQGTIEQDLTERLGQALQTARQQTNAKLAAAYSAYQQALQAEEKRLMREYTNVQGKSTWSAYREAALADWQKTHPDPGKPKAVPTTINLRSSAQLLEALQALGLPVTNTSEEVLEEYEARSDVVRQLLAWRNLNHFITAFGEKLLAHVKSDGRIHANFNQVGAVSGRIICRKPNLQQIPKSQGIEDIRQCFVAPEGFRLLTADLSNIELRILAEFSRDETMLRLFAEGKDLHAETAKLMFNLPSDTNTKEYQYNGVSVRDIAKKINFGLAYGMGAQGLANQINVEVDTARSLMQRYFATYKGVAAWLRQTAQQAQRLGYAATQAGRKRFFQTAIENEAERASVERAAKNHPIQGTNADILKRALAHLRDALPEGVHLVLVVHDEIVLECPLHLVEEAAQTLKRVMVAACREYLHTVAVPDPDVLIDTFWKKG